MQDSLFRIVLKIFRKLYFKQQKILGGKCPLLGGILGVNEAPEMGVSSGTLVYYYLV